MITKQVCLAIVMGVAIDASAQHFTDPNNAQLYVEEAERLSYEQFHYGSQNVTDQSDEALQLVNDYYLNTYGTKERIERWCAKHPIHPLRNRLQMMSANILVKEKAYEKAIAIYDDMDSEAFRNLPENEQAEANIYSAIAYINTGDIDRAEQRLRSVENTKTHQADIQYYLGYCAYAKGNYAEALPRFEQAENTLKYNNKAGLYIADCLMNNGQPDQALQKIQIWQQAFGGDAGNKELWTESKRIEGEAYYAKGNYQQAINALQTYENQTEKPKRQALYKLGISQFKQGQYAQAAKSLSKSASVASDTMAQSAWIHAGKAYIADNNKRQAGMAFQQAANMNADMKLQEEAFYNYAMSLHEGANMGFGESVTAFEQFMNKYPNSPYANNVGKHLTEVYLNTKNYNAALASIDKIKNPSPEILDAKQKVLYNMGIQSFADGDYASARHYMTQSNATKRNNEAIYWKGESEYRLGDVKTAAADYTTYLNSGASANKALAYYGRGYIRFNEKKYGDALSDFRQYIRTSQANDRQDMKADAYNRIGDCLFTQRKYTEAYEAYGNSLNTARNYGDYSLLQMGLISGLQGNYEKKVELLNQLNSSYTGSAYADNALFEQGRAYMISGNSEKALATFKELVEKYPKSANARKALNEIGQAYQENGQTNEAINQFLSIINDYPNTEDATAALDNIKQIYNAQGKVQEYAELAKKVGKPLSQTELDEMTENAAIMALADENYPHSLELFRQLLEQTNSEEVRSRALEGALTAASNTNDKAAKQEIASTILDGNNKVSADKRSQALLIRAQSNMESGNVQQAVADYRELLNDHLTVYGAQGTIELAQYAYDNKHYDEAEKIIDDFFEAGTAHTYWLARAFLLISDVYAATDREIEAREYLLTLKNNYTENEEINKKIAERLKKLK